MSENEALNVYDAVAMMMDQFAAIGWQKLGLQPDMVSGAISPDLAQAKVAIDLVAHFVQVMDSQLDDEDRRRAQSLVRDLRLNYMEKIKELSA